MYHLLRYSFSQVTLSPVHPEREKRFTELVVFWFYFVFVYFIQIQHNVLRWHYFCTFENVQVPPEILQVTLEDTCTPIWETTAICWTDPWPIYNHNLWPIRFCDLQCFLGWLVLLFYGKGSSLLMNNNLKTASIWCSVKQYFTIFTMISFHFRNNRFCWYRDSQTTNVPVFHFRK